MKGEEAETRRLQGFYRAMSNDEFLALLGDRSALTEVAQRAVEAEAGVRGFVLPADDEPPKTVGIAESGEGVAEDRWVGVISFSVMTEARQATQLLEEHAIPFRLEDEHHLASSGVRRTQYNLLYLSVEKERKAEALALLQSELRLFPGAEVDDHAGEPDAGDAELLQVGDFESAEDAAVAEKALREAGIWFQAEKRTVEADDYLATPAGERTFVEVRMADMERAADVVEAAFAEV